MGMHNPPHPGGIVKRQCLEPLGLTGEVRRCRDSRFYAASKCGILGPAGATAHPWRGP